MKSKRPETRKSVVNLSRDFVKVRGRASEPDLGADLKDKVVPSEAASHWPASDLNSAPPFRPLTNGKSSPARNPTKLQQNATHASAIPTERKHKDESAR